MTVAYVSEVGQHEGREVTLQGWIKGRRSSGKILFLQVRDGTGTIQATLFRPTVGDELFGEAKHFPQESSVRVVGGQQGHVDPPAVGWIQCPA